MSRKQFIESLGATCNNWRMSWSFINEKEKVIVFGAWDINVDDIGALIFSRSWQESDRGRKQPAYEQSREHIRLIEEEGYKLKTFPIIYSDANKDKDGLGPAKIGDFIPDSTERGLYKKGNNWYATDLNIEDKIAKVCWNTKNWKFPSGTEGKSPSSSSYESKYGYGHEEWLCDRSRNINGFHYAFLQPLNLKSNKHVGKTYNISLFTVFNSIKYFVGKIKRAECISKEESKRIYKIYKKNGWIKEMVTELENAGCDPAFFKSTPPEIFFDVKFQFTNVEFTKSGELEEISESDINITTNRYKLLSLVDGEIDTYGAEGHQGNLKNTKQRKRKSGGETTVDPIHDKIQNALCELLRKDCKDLYKKVDIETNRVDIKALTQDNQWHYFEIKTDNAKLSVRKGLGQLLEYSLYPEKNIAKKLIVVSDSPMNNETKKYLKHIRKTFSLPIYYRQFDLENNEFLEEH